MPWAVEAGAPGMKHALLKLETNLQKHSAMSYAHQPFRKPSAIKTPIEKQLLEEILMCACFVSPDHELTDPTEDLPVSLKLSLSPDLSQALTDISAFDPMIAADFENWFINENAKVLPVQYAFNSEDETRRKAFFTIPGVVRAHSTDVLFLAGEGEFSLPQLILSSLLKV